MSLMTTFFHDQQTSYTYTMSKTTFGRIVLIAACGGVMAWVLSLAFDKLMLTPLFCSGVSANVRMCAHSTMLGGDIALLLVNMLLLPLLAVTGGRRPLFVVLSAAVSLWGMTIWTNGFWLWSLGLTVVVMTLVYATLAWLNQAKHNGVAIILLSLFAVLARLVLA